jgi:hypothetical protein
MATLLTYNFEDRIEQTIQEISKFLTTNKTATLPEDAEHTWADKYTVVEGVTNSTIFGLIHCLEALGLGKDLKWDLLRPTILRCVFEEQCTFSKKGQKKIPQGSYVSEKSSGIFKSSSKSEFFTLVDEYHWNWSGSITMMIENGDKKVPLLSHKIETVLTNQADINPRGTAVPKREHEVLLSDLMDYSHGFHFQSDFKINKTDKDCFTPCRNKEIKRWTDFVHQYANFCNAIVTQLDEWYSFESFCEEFHVPTARKEFGILVPVVPIMVDTLPPSIVQDHIHSIETKCSGVTSLMSKVNAQLPKLVCVSTILENVVHICQGFLDGVMYIENLLRKQVIQAIGKNIGMQEIEEYMNFHYRGLLAQNLTPQAFVSDIRLKGCTPEGTISVQTKTNDALCTTSRVIPDGHGIGMRLNASTKIAIQGSHHLHGSISYQFSTENRSNYDLIARARQFSSFMILIGTMISHDEFQSKHGMIVQNKDEFVIPLLFEAIPSAGEFRDAIRSLSPEQQEFCKMFRKMQLESNTFAVVVIQIKPQLERVLNLHSGSLTKEIKLTQDLMKLLLEYQIPTDLLKFEGDEVTAASEKVTKVRESVKMVFDVIEESKSEEEKERKRIAELENLELDHDESNDDYRNYKVKKSGFGLGGGSGLFGRAEGARMSGPMPPAPPGMVMSMAAPQMIPAPAPKPMKKSTIRAKETSVTMAAASSLQMEQLLAQQAQQVVQQAQTSVPVPNPPTNVSQPQPPSYDQSFDYTKVSTLIDQAMDSKLKEATIRPVIIKHDGTVQRSFLKSLLSKPENEVLYETEKKNAYNKALDLLDCLSRSGELEMLHSQVHVFYAVQQAFDDTVMDTIVKKNHNPIHQMEKAMLLLAKTIHGTSLEEIVLPTQSARVASLFSE